MREVLLSHVTLFTVHFIPHQIGKQVADYQSQGKLADDSLVTKALLLHLQELELSQKGTHQSRFGFILDGFPRTTNQAKKLLTQQKKIAKNQHDSLTTLEWPERFKLSFAVNIEVPDHICIDKMKGRRKCLRCNESFNLSNIDTEGFFMPPKLPTPYPCKKCDMDLDWFKRSDDTDEIFVRRMKEFHEQSTAVNQIFREQGKLVDFIPFRGIQDMPVLEEIVNNKADSSDINCNIMQ